MKIFLCLFLLIFALFVNVATAFDDVGSETQYCQTDVSFEVVAPVKVTFDFDLPTYVERNENWTQPKGTKHQDDQPKTILNYWESFGLSRICYSSEFNFNYKETVATPYHCYFASYSKASICNLQDCSDTKNA